MPIPGTTKLHRLEENLGAADVELTADDLPASNSRGADPGRGRALSRASPRHHWPMTKSQPEEPDVNEILFRQ